MKQRLSHIIDTKHKKSGLLSLTLLASFLLIFNFISFKTSKASSVGTPSTFEVEDTQSIDHNSIESDLSTLTESMESNTNISNSYDDFSGDTPSTDTESITAEEIADYAMTLLGMNYSYGGNIPESGFDCSGLIQYIYANFGITLEHKSQSQMEVSTLIDKASLQPGDLIFYGENENVNHVGMYIGNNEITHAKNQVQGVVLEDMAYRTILAYGHINY